MNTKFQLLIIVITGFFSLSSDFTVNGKLSKEKYASQMSQTYLDNTSTGTSSSQNKGESRNDDISKAPTGHEVPGDNRMNTDDDGITHHFHFDRVRKARRHARIFCCVIKIIVTITHAALLVCCYLHVLHH